MISRMLRPFEVADILGVDIDTVRAWINAGELEASDVSRQVSRKPRWLVVEEDLQSFLELRKSRKLTSAQSTRRRKRPTDVIRFFQ